MQEKVIILATPVFFLLIFVELIVGLRRRRNTYRLNDAINSLSLGVLSQISGVFMRLLRIGIYAWMVEHLALFKLPTDSLWVWATGLLFYDLCYYWLHRISHEVNLLWAAHVVHHQSEDYNLTTALRQTSSGALFGWFFYLPMALLGYPLEVFAAVALIDLLYQFWVHTQQIGRLGWFDRVFVSPSNHKVHHAVNDVYLDRNYGGILILWDRLFGSFIEERDDEPIVYGTRSSLRSWNPVWANLEVYAAMAVEAWRTRRSGDKVRIWFARPGWHPADIAARSAAAPFDAKHPLYDPHLTRFQQCYCLIQFSIVLLVTTHFLNTEEAMPPLHAGAYALWLAIGLWIFGGLMERRPHYVMLEVARLVATATGILLGGAWFADVALPLPARIAIMVATLTSLVALKVFFKQTPAIHGYFSRQ